MMSQEHLHQTHSDTIKRLKRAAGHLASIITMIEDERPCLELAQQLHAIEKAVANAKKTLIHDHIDHCLSESVQSGKAHAREALREFKAITKYL
jgi:DNA-binding FrmR family transcriptional regulator